MRPVSLLILAYFCGAVVLFSFVLVLPALWPLLGSASPGPEIERLAKETAHQALRPRLGLAVLLAVVATAAGVWLQVLPGLKRRRSR